MENISKSSRIVLASDAPNVFATFDGTITQPNGTDPINVDLTSGTGQQ